MTIHTPFYAFQSALTSEECNKIINLGLKKEPEEAETFGNNQKNVNKEIKQADKTTQELQKELSKNIGEIDPYVRDSTISWINDVWIYERIYPFLLEANEKSGWKYEFESAEDFQFTTYKNGGFYGWHLDCGTCHNYVYLKNVPDEEKIKGKEKFYTDNPNLVGKIRKLSMTLNLSDPNDYEGGYLMFDLGEHQPDSKNNKMEEIKKRGSLIIFPSFLYHQVSPVTKGTRHSLVCWILGAPFK